MSRAWGSAVGGKQQQELLRVEEVMGTRGGHWVAVGLEVGDRWLSRVLAVKSSWKERGGQEGRVPSIPGGPQEVGAQRWGSLWG